MKLANLLPRSELVICFKCGSIETHTEQFLGNDPNTSDTYCFNCEDNANIKVFTTNGLDSEQIRDHFVQLEKDLIRRFSEIEVELEITKAIMPKIETLPQKWLKWNKLFPPEHPTNSLGIKIDPDFLDSPV